MEKRFSFKRFASQEADPKHEQSYVSLACQKIVSARLISESKEILAESNVVWNAGKDKLRVV